MSYKRPFLRNAQRRAAARATTAAACTTAAVGIFGAGTASATQFGIADDWFPTYANSGQTDNATFNTLKANLPVTNIRLVVPWNALGENHTSNGTTTCQADNVTDTSDYIHPSGGTMTSAIQSFLGKAKNDGLNVTVDFDHAIADGSGSTPTLTDSNYKCGVEQFVLDTDSWGDSVHSWEPLNEPAGYISDGATAAGYYADLTAAVGLEAASDQVSHSGDMFAAGVFGTGTSDAYVNAYVGNLKARGISPAAWSFHPYVDFTSWLQGTNNFAQTRDRINAIDSESAGYSPQIWIDEAGFNANGSGVSDTAARMYSAGQQFLGMSSNVSGQITREYWSEFQNRQNPGGIDSAMFSLAGQLRGQYCALARLPLSSCPAGK